ncbi:molybdopterin-dependent oxidoreductase [Rhodococcus aerolatus]
MSTREHPTASRTAAALAGLLAVAAALGVSHLVAAFVDPPSSPFLAVGNSAIDRTPVAVKDFAISQFGSNDKLALLLGMAVVLAIVGVIIGLLARLRLVIGVVLVALVGVVGLLAVLNRPDTAPVGAVSAVVALVVGVAVLVGLLRVAPARARTRAAQPTDDTEGPARRPATSHGLSRRGFLGTSAAVAVGAGAAGYAGQLVRGDSGVSKSRATVGTIAAADPLPALPAGADFTESGGKPFLTPNAEFYRVDTALSVPAITASDWSLKIHGMVDKEITVNFDELVSRPLLERRVTFTCVSNEVGGGLVSTADWVGVSLRDLLAEAGVQDGADQVLSTSIDGYSAGTPLADVMEEGRGAMLAVNMNGEPLPAEHGFPVRQIVPGIYGYANATKWIVDIEITTFAAKQAYWVPRGYAEKAPVKTGSAIFAPTAFQRVPGGTVTVTGAAWDQTVGISKVEVRVDSGEWQEARLGADVSDDTWRMWRADLDVTETGVHLAEVRATNKQGQTQTQDRVPPLPDGATGWPSVSFSVS